MAERQKLALELRQIADQIFREKGTAEVATLRAEEERRKRELDARAKAEIERIECKLQIAAAEGKTTLDVVIYGSKEVADSVMAWGIENGFISKSIYIPSRRHWFNDLEAYSVVTFSW